MRPILALASRAVSRPFRVRAILLGLLWAGAGFPASALECPVPHPSATPTAIKETGEQIAVSSKQLTDRGGAAVPDIVSALKKKYPSASNAEIVNYLITLYCPTVAQNAALSDGEKSARLAAFSSEVERELFK